MSADVFTTYLNSGAGSFGPLTQAILATFNTSQQAVVMYGPAPQNQQAAWRALLNAVNALEQSVIALQNA